jgi:hypothetical protein
MSIVVSLSIGFVYTLLSDCSSIFNRVAAADFVLILRVGGYNFDYWSVVGRAGNKIGYEKNTLSSTTYFNHSCPVEGCQCILLPNLHQEFQLVSSFCKVVTKY